MLLDPLLVATKNYLAYFDGAKLHRVHEGAYHYYGITQLDTGEVLVASSDEHLNTTILAFDASLTGVRTYLELGKCDVHQILADGAGFWLCNTWNDSLDRYERGERVRHWRPFPTTDDLHFNSVNLVGERLYVSAHNRSRRPGEVWILDRDFRPYGVFEVGHEIHNVWPDNDALLVLATTDTCVVRLVHGRRESVRLHDRGWLRGVAASARRTYVGLSNVVPRAERRHGAARILVYETLGTRPDAVIELADAGQVYELRLVDQPDAGHGGRTLALARAPCM